MSSNIYIKKKSVENSLGTVMNKYWKVLKRRRNSETVPQQFPTSLPKVQKVRKQSPKASNMLQTCCKTAKRVSISEGE